MGPQNVIKMTSSLPLYGITMPQLFKTYMGPGLGQVLEHKPCMSQVLDSIPTTAWPPLQLKKKTNRAIFSKQHMAVFGNT